jgi:hypothetical protein
MKTRDILPNSNEVISLLELKLLAKSIISKHAKIRIKCLLEGGSWTGQFLSVMMVTEKGLVLSDDSNNKIKSIRFIDQIVQFVIDKPFDSYTPNMAYIVS